jgi:hypothetical protein
MEASLGTAREPAIRQAHTPREISTMARFFKNGVQHGPGHAAGSVTGAVVAAVQTILYGSTVRLLSNAHKKRANFDAPGALIAA